MQKRWFCGIWLAGVVKLIVSDRGLHELSPEFRILHSTSFYRSQVVRHWIRFTHRPKNEFISSSHLIKLPFLFNTVKSMKIWSKFFKSSRRRCINYIKLYRSDQRQEFTGASKKLQKCIQLVASPTFLRLWVCVSISTPGWVGLSRSVLRSGWPTVSNWIVADQFITERAQCNSNTAWLSREINGRLNAHFTSVDDCRVIASYREVIRYLKPM